MLERHYQPLLSRRQFSLRMLAFFAVAVAIDSTALAVSALGFHFLEGFTWVDSVVNAAMIMTGNGPIVELTTTGGKLFAAVDALLGEALYVVVVAVLLAPIFHRLMHTFHLEPKELEEGKEVEEAVDKAAPHRALLKDTRRYDDS